ncbi:MAG TPA: hypothetical protein VGS00_04455 [Thermoanaerobaculia bacterium]|nr:hypothetical protein [Thermoanaerobaculia bacterium]
MTFLRQTALLLPSAFLVGLLLFLVTHPRTDPGFGTYAFFTEWGVARAASMAPEVSFAAQSFVFFAPAYLLTLLFIFCIAVAERAAFGSGPKAAESGFRRSFAPVYNVLYLAASGVLVFVGDGLARKHLAGTLVAPLLVAAAPFAAAALAIVPAALLAAPLSLFRRAEAA